MATALLEKVTKRFPDHLAVDQIDLNIAEGEFLVLVGPSGCGKSTTLRMIAGLERATSGNIWIGNELVNLVSPRDRDIAMVFQNYALYPHMTVLGNLSYALRLRGVRLVEIERRVKQAAAALDLSELLRRRPAQLSGGQRQRVALGRAIIRQPKLFLMDEPLSNLDAKLRVQTRAEITRLQREIGVTTIYVTHDQTEAMTMGSQIVVMNEGRIQQVDAPRQLYHHPANTFVAQFVGTPPMNLLNCHIDLDGGMLRGDGVRVSFPVPLLTALASASTDRPLLVGFRPEDAALLNGSSECEFEGSVIAAEELGHETLVTLENGEQRFIVRLAPALADRAQLGDRVLFAVDPEKLRFFDTQTGAAISVFDISDQLSHFRETRP